MQSRLVIGGYASLDRIIRIDKPASEGRTSLVINKNNSDIFIGGCSVNIAVLLAKLGVSALPLLRVGSDYESSGFKSYLDLAGVDLSAIVQCPSDRMPNCYLIESEAGNHITLFYPGSQHEKYFQPYQGEWFAGATAAILTVGSRLDNAAFLESCKTYELPLIFGMKTDVDAFPEELLREILTYATIIFMNESEEKDIVEFLHLSSIEQLFDLGKAQILITTRGKEGSTYREKTGQTIMSGQVPIVQPKCVEDTTGSGDAYIAGFTYAKLQGYSTAAACSMGSTLASIVLEGMGSTTNAPAPEALLARFKENHQ